jgi:hypothetical protein
MLWYKRVLHTMFSNTLFAGLFHDKAIKWPRRMLHLLVGHKGDAHETLSLVFKCNGVPLTMVTNDSKEQTKGEF